MKNAETNGSKKLPLTPVKQLREKPADKRISASSAQPSLPKSKAGTSKNGAERTQNKVRAANATSKNSATTKTSTPKSTTLLIPEKVEPTKLGDYLEIITMAMFQAGISWALVHKKWPAFRKAFADFEPEIVAKFGKKDLARLMSEDSGILRSEKKINATIENAKTLLALDESHGGFRNYLRSFTSYSDLTTDFRKHFKFIGELSAYYILFRSNEQVPDFDQWSVTIEGDHPRMREMVQKSIAETLDAPEHRTPSSFLTVKT